MQKYFILGAIALVTYVSFTGCSSKDLYDAELVEDIKQKEQIASLNKTYEDAFIQKFGTISSDQDWGFGSKTSTRTAITSEEDLDGKFELPSDASYVSQFNNGNNNKYGEGIWAIFYQAYLNDLAGEAINKNMTKQHLNDKSISNGKPFGNGATGAIAVSDSYLTIADVIADLGDLSSYYLQHVYKNVKGSPQHNDYGQLYAYNYTKNDWEAVVNFEKGKNNKTFIEKQNLVLKGYTLMANMGAVDATKPMLRWNFKKAESTFSSDYKILKIEGDYYIGLNDNKAQPNGSSSSNEQGEGKNFCSWIIRIAKAEPTDTPITEKKQGRIFCEDMGTIGDFDFNDVVFDAEYLDNGDIKITVLAAGGTLKIEIDGHAVTLGKMTNTGEGEPVSPQTIIIGNVNGQPKYSNLIDIPIMVYPEGNNAQPYELTAPKGGAPRKFCTYVGINWPDEYVSIERVYPDFGSWVNHGLPATWTSDEVIRLSDQDLDNNEE